MELRSGLQNTHVFCNRVRFGRSRSSKVDDFRTNRKRVCDFLFRPVTRGVRVVRTPRHHQVRFMMCKIIIPQAKLALHNLFRAKIQPDRHRSTELPNAHVLLRIACMIPVTSCECERTASNLCRLHTFTRASMAQDRLGSLALIHNAKLPRRSWHGSLWHGNWSVQSGYDLFRQSTHVLAVQGRSECDSNILRDWGALFHFGIGKRQPRHLELVHFWVLYLELRPIKCSHELKRIKPIGPHTIRQTGLVTYFVCIFLH